MYEVRSNMAKKSPTRRSTSKDESRPKSIVSEDSAKSKDSETRCEVFCRVFIICVKRFITFLFSHVGLTCVVVGYTILGGLIFKEIELPEEKLTRQRVIETKAAYSEIITEFYYNADKDKILEKGFWNREMNKLLRDYEKEIFKYTKEKDWDGQFEGQQYQWSFAESLLYSVTVITTIG